MHGLVSLPHHYHSMKKSILTLLSVTALLATQATAANQGSDLVQSHKIEAPKTGTSANVQRIFACLRHYSDTMDKLLNEDFEKVFSEEKFNFYSPDSRLMFKFKNLLKEHARETKIISHV